MFHIRDLDNKHRWVSLIVSTGAVIMSVGYTPNKDEAIAYNDRPEAYDVARRLREHHYSVIALPDDMYDPEYSADRVGGLKLVPLSPPSPLATAGDMPLVSVGQAQPGTDTSQDDETGGTTADETPTPVTPATTNAVCTVRPTREQITEMFQRVLKGD